MIVKSNQGDLLTYLEDTSNIKGQANSLYIPESKFELIQLIKDCYQKKIPFTISGARTGTTGGCIPSQGVIISLERLNKILDIDTNKKIVRAQAGISLEALEAEVNKFNLSLKASPTEGLASLGGVVSTSASGVRGFGYGSIRNYIIGIEVILATGELLAIKRGRIKARKRDFNFEYKGRWFKFKLPSYTTSGIKAQAGYFVNNNMDLIDLFIGSEGTLGVVVTCEVLLGEIADATFDGLLFFPREKDALDFSAKVKRLKRENKLNPTCLEFFDSNSLKMLKKEYSFIPDCAGAIYFEQEVSSRQNYDVIFSKWQVLIEESKASLDKSIIADAANARKKIFDFRHKLPQIINEFLRQNKQQKAATDIAVADNKFDQMYDFYKEIAKNANMDYVNFGHIGESHLHFNFLPKTDQESLVAKKYIRKLCEKAVELGGTISAEHGIGKIKKPYLEIMYSKEQIKEMADLKKYFDQNCLLGLDNIFDKELLKRQ